MMNMGHGAASNITMMNRGLSQILPDGLTVGGASHIGPHSEYHTLGHTVRPLSEYCTLGHTVNISWALRLDPHSEYQCAHKVRPHSEYTDTSVCPHSEYQALAHTVSIRQRSLLQTWDFPCCTIYIFCQALDQY